MTWGKSSPDEWLEMVDDLLEANLEGDALETFRRYQLVPPGFPDTMAAAFHGDNLTVEGDFVPPMLLTAIDGDLTVAGTVSGQDIDGADGGASLVIFGDLRCDALVIDWASTVLVTGNCHIADWAFVAREDCALIVGGDFTANKFIGADIWVEAGGAIDIAYGDGYGVHLGANDLGMAEQVRPRHGWRALAGLLGGDAANASDEIALVELLDRRLYQTGTIYAE